jgi:hypothetical protein
VTLGDGLEEIGEEVFEKCTLLAYILIPAVANMIHDTEFRNCLNLTSIKFCDEIEDFVSWEAMWD